MLTSACKEHLLTDQIDPLTNACKSEVLWVKYENRKGRPMRSRLDDQTAVQQAGKDAGVMNADVGG